MSLASSHPVRLVAALLLCAQLCTSAHADEHERRVARRLVLAGANLFVIGWSTSFSWTMAGVALKDFTGIADEHYPPPTRPYDTFQLFNLLPVFGPWIVASRQLTNIPADKAVGSSDANEFNTLLPFIIPGAVQAVGACLMVAGAVKRKRALASLPTISAGPLPGGALVSLTGRF
jgi:hypothetical protein